MASLTDKQLKWLSNHFKHTKNDEIMAKLNISHSMLHRIAREMGLKKTKQFQRQCQLNAAAKAKASHLTNGTFPPKGYKIPNAPRFKKGESGVGRFGAKKEAERIAKSAESRRQTVKAERRRILFGLPQKTKLKLVSAGHSKSAFRHLLKKRGYVVGRGSNVVRVTETTNRSPVTENRAMSKYKFLIQY